MARQADGFLSAPTSSALPRDAYRWGTAAWGGGRQLPTASNFWPPDPPGGPTRGASGQPGLGQWVAMLGTEVPRPPAGISVGSKQETTTVETVPRRLSP